MDVLNISDFTDDLASNNSEGLVSLDTVSVLSQDFLTGANVSVDTKDAPFLKESDGKFESENGIPVVVMDENEEEEEQINQIAFTTDDSSSIMEESLVLGLASSFPANLNEESFQSAAATESMMSDSYGERAAALDLSPGFCHHPFSHHLKSHTESLPYGTTTDTMSRTSNDEGEGDQGSNPYAQLCFLRETKDIIAMLEFEIVNGQRKRRSRLPLDTPNTDDEFEFPWLHQDTATKTLASVPGDDSMTVDCSISQEDLSSSSSNVSTSGEHEEAESEPVILSGWMIHVEEMSEEEADIYWLLNDGNDVWVKVDDGCAKALKKMWTSCSRWKLKRSTIFHQAPMTDDDVGPQGEKRFRYSMM